MSNSEMSDALEDLYEAFRRPAPRHIDACPCCRDGKGIAALLGKPLRQLSGAELSAYTASAFYTMGDVADFKYFLPRMLEIAASPDPERDVEIVLKKLDLADWESWRKDEIAALQAFVQAWYLQTIANAEDTLDAWALDGMVCGLALAGFDMSAYLKRLLDHPLVLMAWYEENPKALDGKLRNAFWQHNDEKMRPVLAFAASPEVQAIVR